jgi:hypothetical protein
VAGAQTTVLFTFFFDFNTYGKIEKKMLFFIIKDFLGFRYIISKKNTILNLEKK